MTNLNKQIQSATNFLIKQPYRRIQSFEVSGLRFWLKQSEKLDFIVRIQKGNPVVALKQELQGIKDFGDKGIFVPKIVMVGPSYYVMQDTGPTIVNLLHKHNLSEKERIEILENSAEALARLHSKELVHGRPAIKDISYFEGRITFLDLERYKKSRNTPHGKILDLIIFVHSLFKWSNAQCVEVDRACQAYIQNGGEAVWKSAQKWCYRLRWISILTRPLQIRKNRGTKFKPIPFILEKFSEEV